MQGKFIFKSMTLNGIEMFENGKHRDIEPKADCYHCDKVQNYGDMCNMKDCPIKLDVEV